MASFSKYSNDSIRWSCGRVRRVVTTLLPGILLCALMVAAPSASDVSQGVNVTHNGFGRHRTTGVWTATLTVKNTSGDSIAGPIQVVLTRLASNVTMVNRTGVRDGDPYITVTTGTLAPGASASVTIQFSNPSNQFIEFTSVTYSGGI